MGDALFNLTFKLLGHVNLGRELRQIPPRLFSPLLVDADVEMKKRV